MIITLIGEVSQIQPQQTIGLYNAFQTSIAPLFYDIGKTLFWCSVAYGGYHIIQMRYTEGINRIKWAAIGWIILRMTDQFLQLTDKVANNMKF